MLSIALVGRVCLCVTMVLVAGGLLVVYIVFAASNVENINVAKLAFRTNIQAYDPTRCAPVGAYQELGSRVTAVKPPWSGAGWNGRGALALFELVASSEGQTPDTARLIELSLRPDPLTNLAAAARLWCDGRQAEALIAWRRTGAGTFFREQADVAIRAHDVEHARQLYLIDVQVEPTDPAAEAGLARIYRAKGQTDQAVVSYTRAFGLGLSSADDAWQLGKLLAGGGRYADAEAWYYVALSLRPNEASYLIDLGDSYWLSGLAARAGDTFAEAVRVAPNNPWVHVKYGQYLAASGRVNEGIEELQHSIRLMPDNAAAWLALASVYERQLKAMPEAVAAYRQAAVLDPSLAAAHAGLGTIFLESGNYSLARKELTTALRLDPQEPDARKAILALGVR